MTTKIIFDETIKYHLKHPVTGELLYLQKKDKQKGTTDNDLDKPMLVEIYGKHTGKFKTATSKMLRETAQQTKDLDKQSPEYQDTVARTAKQLLADCIAGFENVHIETEVGLIDGKDSYKAVSVWWLKEQIESVIANSSDFLQKPNKA